LTPTSGGASMKPTFIRAVRCGVRASHRAVARSGRVNTIAPELEQARRPLRVLPAGLEAEWNDATTLSLAFALPAGVFATAVLREIAAYRDVGGLINLPDEA
jgi:hypothetical protein